MLYFKIIQLVPTMFKLHVISCDDDEHTEFFLREHYTEIEKGQFDEEFDGDWVASLKHEGKTVIVAKFENLKDHGAFVHEITHVKHRLSYHAGVELNYHSQEWEACFTEYIYNEICKPNYEKFKKQ